MRFCGRVAELDELIARWRLASDIATPSPQLVILKAERGVGKTRLALEFYRWLSENVDAKGPDGYWPDSASILDRSIDVNPDPYACRYDQSMPFLWWGLRAADPGTENRISGDAIASYDKFLAPHLVALTMKARAIKSGKALLGVWRDVAKGEAASWSGYDTVMSVGEGLFKTVQILRGTMEQSRSSALGEITKKSINRVDAVLEDLEIVLNTRSPGFAKTPAVILIDDAQFSTEDPSLADFCEKLLHMAMTQKWPLMILVTHWKRDLSPEFMTTERSFAGVVHHARTRAPHENGPVAGLPGGYLTPQVGDLAAAGQAWQECLDIARDLATRLRTPESQHYLSISLDKVGDAAMAAGDLAAAAQVWQEGLGIARDLAARLQTPKSQRMLTVSLVKVGDAAMAAGDLAAATKVWQEGLDIARDLAARLHTPESLRDLWGTLLKTGDAAMDAGDLEAAVMDWQDGLDIARGLAARLQTPESQRDLSVSLNRVGEAAKAAGDLAAAAQVWQECIDIARDLAARLPTPQSQRDLCVSLYQLCRLYIANYDLVLAVGVLAEGESLAKQLPLHMRDEAVAAFAGLREEIG